MTTSIMKTLLILALFASVAFADPFDNAKEVFNKFKDWSSKSKRKYGIEETAIRYAAWKNNYDLVQRHNAQNLSWELGLNDFADLTPEEFSALNLGFRTIPALLSATQQGGSGDSDAESSTPLLGAATSLDWRNSSAVTAVKNQGSCGSCWAFATTGALEGLHAIKKSQLLNFSEQQLVDCATSSYGNYGCNGGMYTGTFSYTAKNGIMLGSDYAYTGKQATCKYTSSKAVFKNLGYKQVGKNNATLLKAAVNLQPIAVAIQADQSAFQLYKSGIITSNCGTSLNHAVLVVGYDVSSTGVEYWIVKNSWGTYWGNKGYVNIATGQQNSNKGVCGINSLPAYPTL